MAMHRNRLRSFVFTIGLLCAAPLSSAGAIGPWLTGNDTGGIIPWSPANQAVALDMAAAHCARFDKYALITSIHPWYGDYIAFACAFDPPAIVVRHRAVVLRVKG
jgi:hypothetical protein